MKVFIQFLSGYKSPAIAVEADGGPSLKVLDQLFSDTNKNNTPLRKRMDSMGCPSMSVGDVVHMRGDMWVVLPGGFYMLSPEEYREYIGLQGPMEQHDREEEEVAMATVVAVPPALKYRRRKDAPSHLKQVIEVEEKDGFWYVDGGPVLKKTVLKFYKRV